MNTKNNILLDFIVDKLTNSIQNTISGDSFSTDLLRFTLKDSKMRNILKYKYMGFIKEPKGVDFIVKSDPLTDKDRQEISKFIVEYKAKEKERTKIKRKQKSKVIA